MKNERFLVKCHGKRETAKRVPAVYGAMEIAIWGVKNSPSIFGKATVNRRFSWFNIHVICSKPVSFFIYDSRGGAQESTGQPTSVFKIGPFKRPWNDIEKQKTSFFRSLLLKCPRLLPWACVLVSHFTHQLPGQSASRIQELQKTTNQRPSHIAILSVSGTKHKQCYARKKILKFSLGINSKRNFENNTRGSMRRRFCFILTARWTNQIISSNKKTYKPPANVPRVRCSQVFHRMLLPSLFLRFLLCTCRNQPV